MNLSRLSSTPPVAPEVLTSDFLLFSALPLQLLCVRLSDPYQSSLDSLQAVALCLHPSLRRSGLASALATRLSLAASVPLLDLDSSLDFGISSCRLSTPVSGLHRPPAPPPTTAPVSGLSSVRRAASPLTQQLSRLSLCHCDPPVTRDRFNFQRSNSSTLSLSVTVTLSFEFGCLLQLQAGLVFFACPRHSLNAMNGL